MRLPEPERRDISCLWPGCQTLLRPSEVASHWFRAHGIVVEQKRKCTQGTNCVFETRVRHAFRTHCAQVHTTLPSSSEDRIPTGSMRCEIPSCRVVHPLDAVEHHFLIAHQIDLARPFRCLNCRVFYETIQGLQAHTCGVPVDEPLIPNLDATTSSTAPDAGLLSRKRKYPFKNTESRLLDEEFRDLGGRAKRWRSSGEYKYHSFGHGDKCDYIPKPYEDPLVRILNDWDKHYPLRNNTDIPTEVIFKPSTPPDLMEELSKFLDPTSQFKMLPLPFRRPQVVS